MEESSILKWAAGGQDPRHPKFDEELLLAAVRRHHMAVRLHHRLTQKRPMWARPSFVSNVADLAADARKRTRELYKAYRELCAATRDREVSPLLSKGFTFFLLLNNDRAVTWSRDLDLFSKNLPGLRDELTDIGYVADRKSPPQPHGRKIFHEFAKLDRGSIQIDLHSRFPAWSYPPEAGEEHVTSPPDNPGVWRCVNYVNRGEITIADLFANMVLRDGPDGQPVPVTGPEMTALVSACHLFANYLTEFPRPFGTIRLGELANMNELISQPWFDWTLFELLASRCKAQDCVAFVLSLIEAFFGRVYPIANGARRPREAVPPRCLWFARGEGVFLVSTAAIELPDDLLVRETDTRDLVRYLGPNKIIASSNDPILWYGTLNSPAGAPLGRVLVHETADQALPLVFGTTWDDAALSLIARLPPAPPAAEQDMLLYFGNVIYECVDHPNGTLHVYDRTVEARVKPGCIPFVRASPGDVDGVMYRVSLPWSKVPSRPPADQELYMMLGVRRWPKDGKYPISSTLIPIELHLRP